MTQETVHGRQRRSLDQWRRKQQFADNPLRSDISHHDTVQ